MLAMFGLPANRANAQGTTATLSGIVVDDTGALIPDAEATLRNGKSGSVRVAKSNSAGVFVFAAVPTGDYDVLVERKGFKANSIHGIHLDPQDNKSLSEVKLQIGEVTEVVNVSAEDSGLIGSGEKSTLITSAQIQKLSVEGRDVGELVKMLPGFAIAQTTNSPDNSTYDPSQVSVAGALRNYAASGNSANAVSMLSDGTNITDPGDYGQSIQNVNSDMVEEVKIQTSNFTAENSNGPIVVNAVGKSGGQSYHGSVYVYGRTYQLNSQDWLSNYQGLAKPQDRYIYPGGNIGGPIRIPGTDFNHQKKLTFFAGAEDYAQRNIYAYGSASQAIIHALVPTATMRTGDFSCATLQVYLGSSAISCNANGTSNILNTRYENIASVPTQTSDGHTIGNGQIGSAFIDPGGSALIDQLPLPNTPNTGAGYNYVHTNLVNNDLWQSRVRVDDAISERLKFFATYNIERGNSGVPEVPYYSPAQTSADGGVDTPGGGLLSTVNSQTMGLNLTWIPSSRLTNETTANLGYLRQAFAPKTPSALSAATIGYPYKGFYPTNGSTQYPQLADYNVDGTPLALFPDFSVNQPYAKKVLPSVGDNVTFVVKTHTLKTGVYVQKVSNNQVILPSSSSTNGQISLYYFGSSFVNPNGATEYTSGNYLANFLEGQIQQFSQQSALPQQNLYFYNVNWYVTDSWKVSKKLSVDYGIRFEHLGPWQDAHGTGIAVFEPSQLNSSTTSLPGFTWHAADKSIPNSGAPARFAFYEPRAGLSYDFYGNGTTVFRGGWGAYRNHDDWNVVQQAAALAQGVRITAITGGQGISLSQLTQATAATQGAQYYSSGVAVNAYALDPTDNEQPLTYTYSATVDQVLPKKAHFEIGYVGNEGKHLTAQNVDNLSLSLQNINPVPRGALFQPNPQTGAVVPVYLIDSLSTTQVNQYRPYPEYGNIYVPRHILYSFYNGLQASLSKQSGHLNYGVNYTWSKALGIKDGYFNGNAADATNLRNNYGPLSFDRTHIFNANYSFDLGTPFHGARLLRGVLNSWQISGITGVQSGPNLQGTLISPDFDLQGKLGANGSPTQLNVDSKTFLGTPDVSLQPVTTCNPAVHTKPNQYINANCLTLPQIGQNGPFNYPYLHGPAYFNSDLTVVKNFPMRESRDLQIRFAAFNFLNHPLHSFSSSYPTQVDLNLSNLNAGGEVESPSLATPAAGFGVTTIKEGRRVAEIAVKYNF